MDDIFIKNNDYISKKSLSIHDNELIKNRMESECSFYSKKIQFKKLDNYEYYETDDGEDIYYANIYYGYASFFFDKNKNLIYSSRYFDEGHLKDFTSFIFETLNSISESELLNAEFIGEKIISITKWFITYGHYKDEAFALCDFHNKFSSMNPYDYKILLDYHTNSDVITNYPVFENYKLIDKYLFENKSINACTYNRQILKMNKLILMKHLYNSKPFHLFPLYSTNIILSKIPNLNYNYNNVFISRKAAMHIKRNLDNENEINSFLKTKQFLTIYPEDLSYESFINHIRNANNIVITWGGALTNMVYLKNNCNVIILKSKSYEHESISLFNKIIKNYKLNIKIITHNNNKIDLNKLNECIKQPNIKLDKKSDKKLNKNFLLLLNKKN